MKPLVFPRRPPAPFAAWTWRSSRSWWRWRRRPRPRPCTATRGRRRRRRCSPRRVGSGWGRGLEDFGETWRKLGGNLEETWRNWMNLGKNGGFNISSCFKNILNGDVRWWSCSVVKLSIYGQAPWRWLPEEQLVDLNAPDDIHDYTHRNLANNYTHTYYIYIYICNYM